jgi:hypothetical protein
VCVCVGVWGGVFGGGGKEGCLGTVWLPTRSRAQRLGECIVGERVDLGGWARAAAWQGRKEGGDL